MADNEHDEPRRRPGAAGGSPALADEGDVAFGAMAGTAVLIALLVAVFLPQLGIIGGDTTEKSHSEDKVEETVEEEVAAETTTTTEAATTTTEAPLEVDLPLAAGDIEAAGFDGLDISLDGRDLIATGVVADEAERAQVLDILAAQPNVENVIDQLEVPEPVFTEATVTASQGGITLAGEVPSQDIADDMVARAATVYAEDQITNELTVADGEVDGFAISYSGVVTDDVLGARLNGLFDDVEGATVSTDVQVIESSDAEAALNGLEPIQFASGSAEILAESAVVLDEAAEILNGDPSLALEVGGHTDSRGDDAANQALSEARAQAVVAALQEREVTNDLTPRGFGESRLKVDPDDTAEAQQENRRIEFRVL